MCGWVMKSQFSEPFFFLFVIDLSAAFLISHQVMQFLGLLFGEDAAREIPRPDADKDGFMRVLRSKLASTKPQFNVITKKVTPLIDVDKLKSHLKKQKKGGKTCVIS